MLTCIMNNKQNDDDSKSYELYFFENPITKKFKLLFVIKIFNFVNI